MIVHRKGATPAGKDMLGINPGTLTILEFVLKKEEDTRLLLASNGVSRLSRTAALYSVPHKQLREMLKKGG